MAKEKNLAFLVRAEIDYDKDYAIPMCVDLSMFPHFSKVSRCHLSKDQQKEADRYKRDVDKEPAKLISTML